MKADIQSMLPYRIGEEEPLTMHTCPRIACFVALIAVSACSDETDHSAASPAVDQVEAESRTHENTEPPYADLVGYQVVIASTGENRGAVGTVVAARRDVIVVENYKTNVTFLVPHDQITLIICQTCGGEYLSADERDFLSERRKAIAAEKEAERVRVEEDIERLAKEFEELEEEERKIKKPEME